MLRTPLCDLLGLDVPIVQAPVAVSPQLAAAVSEAGALGSIMLSWARPEEIGALLDDVRRLTGRPFAVNLLLEWDQHARLDAALAAGARIVSLAWGDPAPYTGPAHEAGALVLASVGSAEEARRAVAAGADVVVAQGWEAGGHVWGGVATLPLVPAVVDAVAPVPVVAAGGIADGRGIAAALVLGAAGAWLGTRFVATVEAPHHPVYKERVLAASETETVYATELFDLGWGDAPHRVLRNTTTERWEAAGRPARERPGEGEVVAHRADGGAIRRYESTLPLGSAEGDVEAMALYAGQSAALVRELLPAGELVRRLAAEAETALRHQTRPGQ